MTIVRWTPQEVKATKLLTEKFGTEFWKKAIMVLTKANMVKPPAANENEKAFCKRVYDSFERMFQGQLIDQGVHAEIANNIPEITAGSDRDRFVPYVSNFVSDTSGQEYQDFLPELWLTCFECMSGKSQFNFLKVTNYSKQIKINKDCLPYKRC